MVDVQPGVPRVVLQSRVPVPQGAVHLGRNSAYLPGSALSLTGELSTVLWGKAVGGRSDPQQGRVFLLSRGCSVGRGCSDFYITLRTFAEGHFKDGCQDKGLPERVEICALNFLLLVGWLGHGRWEFISLLWRR